MALCSFSFIFDINLTFPDNTHFLLRVDGEDVQLTFERVKSKKVISFSDNLDWINDKTNSYFVAAQLTTGDTIPFRAYKQKKENASFISGIIDEANLTKINTICKVDTYLLEKEDFLDKKINWLQNILLKFIDNYCHITQDAYVSRNDILKPLLVDVFVSDENDFPKNHSRIEFKVFKTQFNFESPKESGFVKKDVSSNQVEDIQNRLVNNIDIQLFEKILQNAKENAFRQKNYDMSVVLTGSAFEVFLQQVLIECCKFKRITKLTVGRGNKQKEIDFYEAIINGNVREHLINNYLKYLTGKSIAGSKEYNNWYANSYEKRNDIIHKGNYGTTREEAQKAFDSTNILINKISELISSTRSYIPS